MKRVLFVCDNLHIGGIQKALINMLDSLSSSNEYSITLFLINGKGDMLDSVSDKIVIRGGGKLISVLGATKNELRACPVLYVWKSFLVLLSKLVSKNIAFKIASINSQIEDIYDISVSFSHPSVKHSLVSCSPEFVLSKTKAKRKICFVHCDYSEMSNRDLYTDEIYRQFDCIACCSRSVKERFLGVLPELSCRTYVVRNFYDLSFKNRSLLEKPFVFDSMYVNVICVARLTSEKGVSRLIQALFETNRNDIRIYLIGDGPARDGLVKMVREYGLSSQVYFLGEDKSPAKYMVDADYLILPSFQEAAPMVFDEAKIMGLPIITTATTSATEMVGEKWGVVCENSLQGLIDVLCKIRRMEKQKHIQLDNALQLSQLSKVFG